MVIGAKVRTVGNAPHVGAGRVEGVRIGREETDGRYKAGVAIAYVRWETGKVGEWECRNLIEMKGR